jgi:hypothetical protein
VRAYLAHRKDQPPGPAARAFRKALLRGGRDMGDGSPRTGTLDAPNVPQRLP